jgi:hypothetical protein
MSTRIDIKPESDPPYLILLTLLFSGGAANVGNNIYSDIFILNKTY